MPIIINSSKYDQAATHPRAAELLAARSVKQGDCTVWTGPATRGGYGLITVGGQSMLVHRLAQWLDAGAIPDGLTVDHLCRNTRCVDTSHFELVTAQVNASRSNSIQAKNARKTHCKRDHIFNDENTSIRVDAKGRISRQCKRCKREAARRQWIRNQ